MHTSRVSSPRHSASRLFFCLEPASLYSSPTRLHSPTPPTHFPSCHRFLRHSTPLASTREGAGLPDDPRLASCLTRPLVCITALISLHCVSQRRLGWKCRMIPFARPSSRIYCSGYENISRQKFQKSINIGITWLHQPPNQIEWKRNAGSQLFSSIIERR
jgi:hypothetical protein